MKLPTALFSIALTFWSLHIHSQTSQDASVELSAEVQSSPAMITLNWTSNSTTNQYFVYRKLKTVNSWGPLLASLSGTATQFIDSTATVGVSYEYRVLRSATGFSGYGYINAGIEIPAVETRGTVILVVDSTVVDSLIVEVARLKSDLEGDGWRVIDFSVSRTASVIDIKAAIVSAYAMNPGGVKAVFLLGHVPVPYSGELNPDAHPDHLGAWPADVYYADINGTWTDVSVNSTVASAERNRNIPGDGKFDQSILPSDVEAQIGRVDFANMPAFAESEIQLLRRYLDKDHAYRHKEFSPEYRLLIDDNFGYFGGEAFAANGWKNTPLVGSGKVQSGDYFTELSVNSYLWSYGCGGGSYTSAGGIGNTNDFAVADLQSVFTILFGSYFGDWDSQNNFLRAALAQGKTLTNAWSGRPHWMFHHMGLGETIGYSTRISQNNSSLYFSSFSARGVHIALMGDPTLRNDIVAPVVDVAATMDGPNAQITWSASPDQVMGYHVYVKDENSENYERLNQDLITTTAFTDHCLISPGTYTYMVRALTLQNSPSGTYFNLSQGIIDTVLNNNDLEVQASATWTSWSAEVSFSNTSTNATSYQWIFGDGESSMDENPVHPFGDGEYTVILIASNDCDADTLTLNISVSTGIEDITAVPHVFVSPNPSKGVIRISADDLTQFDITIYDMLGDVIFDRQKIKTGEKVDLSNHPEGVYLVVLSNGDHSYGRRVVIQR